MTDIIIFLKFQSFFAEVVQLTTEAGRFKRPSKTSPDQYSEIDDFFLNSLKPLSLKLFPWTRSLQIENPKMNGFCSKKKKIRLYKGLLKIYYIAKNFSSFIRRTAANESTLQSGFAQCDWRL